MRGRILLSLLLVVFMMISCRKKEAANEITIIPIEKKSHTYNTDFYHMSVEYPEEMWDYKHDMQRYVESVVAFHKRDWSPGGMHYEKEMSFRNVHEEKEYPKRELYIRFQKFTSTLPDIHSYLFSAYVTTHGANGSTSVAAFNFNQDGLIGFDDVFLITTDQEIELARLLAVQTKDSVGVFDYSQVRRGLGLDYILEDGVSLDSLEMKKNDFTFRKNLNAFVLADTGIHFHFDKYALAPGSSGTTSIFLNWEQLKPFLQNKFDIN